MQQLQFVGCDPETFINTIVERVESRILSAIPTAEKPEPADRFLTLVEAAEFLHLKPATIYNLTHQRELPHIKRGNRLYFSERTLTEYLEGGRQLTRAEAERAAEEYCNGKAAEAALKGGCDE